MHKIVQIERLEYGEETHDKSWHLVDDVAGTECAFCTGDVYSEGDAGFKAKYKVKEVHRGGITCKDCLDKLAKYKEIKL